MRHLWGILMSSGPVLNVHLYHSTVLVWISSALCWSCFSSRKFLSLAAWLLSRIVLDLLSSRRSPWCSVTLPKGTKPSSSEVRLGLEHQPKWLQETFSEQVSQFWLRQFFIVIQKTCHRVGSAQSLRFFVFFCFGLICYRPLTRRDSRVLVSSLLVQFSSRSRRFCMHFEVLCSAYLISQ